MTLLSNQNCLYNKGDNLFLCFTICSIYFGRKSDDIKYIKKNPRHDGKSGKSYADKSHANEKKMRNS